MNIALMTSHFDTGGITSYLLNLSGGLTKRGHKVWVISAKGNCTGFLRERGVTHVPLDIRVKSEAHPKIWLGLPVVMNLIKTEKIDLLHAHTRVTQVMASVAARLTGISFVSTAHGFFRPRLFRRMVPCWGQATIAISRGVQEHLIRDFHLPSSQVVLIANGIDAAQFPFTDATRRQRVRQQWHISGDPLIGTIARMSSVKGMDVFINAMPAILVELPQAKFWIVGDGPDKEKLQHLVAQKGLTHAVTFGSIVNRTADILPAFDVFVMPSLQEGLGLSVMEAQASGIPVVASNVGGLPDLITEDQTGLLVPPGDAKQLAAQIIAMVKDPQKAKDMAAAARTQVEIQFSLIQMVKETSDLYMKVVHEQNMRR